MPIRLVLLTFASLWPPASVISQDLCVVGGQYFDVHSKTFVDNDGIVIENGTIVQIGALSEESEQAERQLLRLEPENYILPGLIDLHAHYNVRLFGNRREEFLVMPAIYLANGATVTFSAGEYDPDGMQELRQQIEKGERLGPRLINSGPYFGRARRGWRRDITADEIRQEVDFWAPRVGGFKAKQIRPEHLQVLIEAAHQHGLTVTGHLDSGYRSSVNPLTAISMGIDRIEHFLGGDVLPDSRSAYATLSSIEASDPALTEVIRFYVDAGVYFDATLTAYGYFGERGEEYDSWIDETQFFTDFVRAQLPEKEPTTIDMFQKIYELKQVTIKSFFDAGGLITVGTDHVSDGHYLPAFGIHRELDVLVRSGIPPADALVMATINGARALRIDDRHGSISPGKVGDLYVIQGNPMDNIRHTRHGKYVVRAGVAHNPSEIFGRFAGKLGPRNEDEKEEW